MSDKVRELVREALDEDEEKSLTYLDEILASVGAKSLGEQLYYINIKAITACVDRASALKQ